MEVFDILVVVIEDVLFYLVFESLVFVGVSVLDLV